MVALSEIRSPSSQAPSPPAADVGRYQLVVVAADPVDAVRRAGALMCDHAMAGWDVALLISDEAAASDAEAGRPAQILGADQLAWAPGATRLGEPALGRSLVVAAEVLRGDPAVRGWVTAGMADHRVDLLLWEREGAPARHGEGDQVQPSTSATAAAFKRHALAAAGLGDELSTAEVFLRPRLVDRRRPAAAPPAATSRDAQAFPPRNCADHPPSPRYGR